MTKKQRVNQDEDPVYRPYERDQARKKKRNSHGKLNSFTWTTAEEILYVEFLKNHKELFVGIKERKKNKVFVSMSKVLKKRGPDQCRSHHQKMSIKYGDIEEIVKRVTEDKILKGLSPQLNGNSYSEAKMEKNFEQEIIDDSCKKLELKESEQQQISTPSDYMDEQSHIWNCLDQNAWLGF